VHVLVVAVLVAEAPVIEAGVDCAGDAPLVSLSCRLPVALSGVTYMADYGLSVQTIVARRRAKDEPWWLHCRLRTEIGGEGPS